jgi:hypothetical protein
MLTLRKWTVHISFPDPAWDETNGLDIEVLAKDRTAALKAARREMADAGHSVGRRSAGLRGLRYTACRLADREYPPAR